MVIFYTRLFACDVARVLIINDSNLLIRGLAFTYFCVYVVRQVTFERYVISSKHEILKSRGIRVSRLGQYFI